MNCRKALARRKKSVTILTKGEGLPYKMKKVGDSMFTCFDLPLWLRKKSVWSGLITLFVLSLVTWLIFGRFVGPACLRNWLPVGFFRLHIGKIAFILMGILMVLFLWVADRLLASPDESNRKTPGDPPQRKPLQKALHLLFAVLMVAVACYTIYKIIMFAQFVHFWVTEDKAWIEANKHLFSK